MIGRGMRTAGAAVVLTLLAGIVAAGGAPAQEAPPASGVIAFEAAGRILAIDSAGGGRRAITLPPDAGTTGGDSSPAFSPDGSLIAFSRSPDSERSQLFVTNADGTGQRAVTPSDSDTLGEPQWSPDGGRLAFTRFRFNERAVVSSIEIVPLGGGTPEVVVRMRFSERTPAFVSSPAFVPGTNRISYTRTELTRDFEYIPELRTIALDGSGDALLRTEAGQAAWSTDGSRIAFVDVGDRNGFSCGSDTCSPNGEIYVMDAGGGEVRRLTDNRGDDAGPEWSADGSRVLFASDRNYPTAESPEIYSIGADGSCLTWLTNGTEESSSPDASPAAGDAPPPSCGEAGRRPLIETQLPRAPGHGRPTYWLGEHAGSLLFSDIDESKRLTFVDYRECGRFDPGDCERPVLLAQEDVCGRNSYLSLRTGLPERYLERRGALVLQFGNGFEPTVVSGTITVSILAGSKQTRDVLGVVDLLRPLGSRRVAKRLPAARVPRQLLETAREVERARAAGFNQEAIATDLGLRDFEVRSLARLAAADDRLGPFATARC